MHGQASGSRSSDYGIDDMQTSMEVMAGVEKAFEDLAQACPGSMLSGTVPFAFVENTATDTQALVLRNASLKQVWHEKFVLGRNKITFFFKLRKKVDVPPFHACNSCGPRASFSVAVCHRGSL
jgi:hypothetical protein